MKELNYELIEDAQVEGRGVDAFIAAAVYDGREMTSDELDILNEDSDYVYERLMDKYY